MAESLPQNTPVDDLRDAGDGSDADDVRVAVDLSIDYVGGDGGSGGDDFDGSGDGGSLAGSIFVTAIGKCPFWRLRVTLTVTNIVLALLTLDRKHYKHHNYTK